MIIAIDGNEANVQKRVGISEYAFELLNQFEKYRVQNVEFRIYLKEKPQSDLPREREGWEYSVVGPKRLWTQIGLPLALFNDSRLKGRQISVFFSPTHYAPRFSPVPTAISIMDLSYVHFPEMFKKSDLYQLKNWTAYSAKKAARIFTISKASKDDIINVYNIVPEKVVVTYPGIKKITTSTKKALHMDTIKKKYGIKGEYILFVGTLQPRKNIVRLIEAFTKINRNDLQLVIVGKKGWLYSEILEAPKKYKIENSVKFLEFVSDEDLTALYQNALCFVLPSLYEGFGLPVLEAMQQGCPVITSNVSSLPEAAGDAALYVDPNDVDDIAAKIQLLLSDGTLRKDLIEKGYKQANKFSWEQTARETLEVLESIATKGA